MITRFTADRVAHQQRPILYWDAWNEPDGPITKYFNGTEQQWLDDVLVPEARAVRAVALDRTCDCGSARARAGCPTPAG